MAPLNPDSQSYTLVTGREKLTIGILNKRFVSDVTSVHGSSLYTDEWQDDNVWWTKNYG
jgi:hypothetical protein